MQIILVKSSAHIDSLRELLWTYMEARGFDEALGNYKEELSKPHQKYDCILMMLKEDKAIGCIAYQELGDKIVEMKRMYVLPKERNKGVGKKLALSLINIARKRGFAYMRLDTHPHMNEAQSLYKKLGFYSIPRYNNNPTQGIRFYELDLKKPGTY
ncbi:MAG: GNAT family N-acetyltransferase [Bacteroidota bacterium]